MVLCLAFSHITVEEIASTPGGGGGLEGEAQQSV